MRFARTIQEVGLDGVVRRIEHAYAISDDGVAVVIRRERIGSDAPDALIVFFHRYRLGHTFE